MAPRQFEFTIDKGAGTERRMSVEIRAMTADESAGIDKLMEGIRPPSRVDGKTGVTTYRRMIRIMWRRSGARRG